MLFGIITKYSRKTVTLITEAGQQWNVAPVFLRKLKSAGAGSSTATPMQVVDQPLKPR